MSADLPRRVLGLDISSRFVGWVLFDDLRPVHHGLLKMDLEGHGYRMHQYFQYLLGLLQTYKPTEVVIELPFAGRHRRTYGILIQYIAITLLAHHQHFGTELPEANKLQAREIKMLLKVPKGANHDDNKRIMVTTINRMFHTKFRFSDKDTKKKFSKDDIADAYAAVYAWLIKHHYVDPIVSKTTSKKSTRRKSK